MTDNKFTESISAGFNQSNVSFLNSAIVFWPNFDAHDDYCIKNDRLSEIELAEFSLTKHFISILSSGLNLKILLST